MGRYPAGSLVCSVLFMFCIMVAGAMEERESSIPNQGSLVTHSQEHYRQHKDYRDDLEEEEEKEIESLTMAEKHLETNQDEEMKHEHEHNHRKHRDKGHKKVSHLNDENKEQLLPYLIQENLEDHKKHVHDHKKHQEERDRHVEKNGLHQHQHQHHKIDHRDGRKNDDHDHDGEEDLHQHPGSQEVVSLSVSNSLTDIPSSIWLASLGSITVISLVGLLAVAALPLLKGPHQDVVLQVLVALAVGTLVGDSLIHLIPHAFGTQHGETSVVWKGFTATLTIVMFFVLDRTLAALGHGHSHGGHGHNKDDLEDGQESGGSTPHMKKKIAKISMASECSENSEDSGMTVGSEGAGSLYSLYKHSYHIVSNTDPGWTSTSLKEYCFIPSSSLMVIVGDAVHNFADGLAVGAAFSLSLAAGLSTSVAVLCHELPHEVGDFALLLTQGMSVRTAIFYNVVSSIFAGFGLLVGLLLGSQEGLSSWLLSATVGVFLYVALVSMMSELQGGGITRLLLNTAGMVGGAILLLFIGLYEHQLLNLFDSSSDSHQH